MVWHPDKDFILKVHERVLVEFGGHKGIKQKRFFDSILKSIFNKMEKERNIYTKAAILLRELATSYLFEDANKRTAFTITHTFLSMNKAKVKRKYEEEETLKGLRGYVNTQLEI